MVKWCCLTLLNGGVLTLYGLLKHITGLIVASDGMLTLTVSFNVIERFWPRSIDRKADT